MNNPLSKIQLSEGIVMKDTEGVPIGDSNPFARDPSRQLTIHEYAAMRSNGGGLKSQISEVMLNRSQASAVKFGNETIAERNVYSMLKPGSAQQVDGEIYIETRDHTGQKQ